jgi:MoaA/NifB/PqqE/SkfB family radical SAM enzyme
MSLLNILGFLRPKTKPFTAWQVELTTRCPLDCRMCIREKAEGWLSGDMRIEDFRKILPYLKDVNTVVLEGWGESLLHKDIIPIIRLVKKEGPKAGFVTSGMVLNSEYISELIDAGVDFIGFSLSGTTPLTHNSIRLNSDFMSIIKNIKTFNKIKAEHGAENPRLHIIFLMVKDNISEVPSLPQFAKDIGIEEIVLINLIHVTNEWQESQRVFRCIPLTHPSPLRGEGEGEGYEEILKEAEIKAKELKINLRSHPLSPVDVGVCEENPLSNLYISVDGEVSPCVYLYPPVPSPFKRIFCGKSYDIEKVSFGNIFKEPFESIWNNSNYIAFRNRFLQRKKMFEEMFSLWNLGSPKAGAYGHTPLLPDPPEQCRICHKMLGV